MSLFDVVAPAADTTGVQGGDQSFLDQAGMALTAGAAGAAFSGLGSIYNTAAAGINFLGGDMETMDTANALDSIDSSWANYYKQNKTAIDVAGFVGTSLLPGTLGVKALNMARAGSGVGAVGRALGFFQTQQAASLSAALGEMAVEGGTIFTQINRAKLASMAWGAADQTLQAAAFETAVAATMKRSPMLADDSWWDIGKSAFVGSVFGGVIGGGIDALILNKSFKSAVSALDTSATKYKYIQNVSNSALDPGDKSFAIIDSLSRLPDEVLSQDSILPLSFHVGRPDKVTGFNSATGKVDLPIGDFLKQTLANTKTKGLLNLETSLRDVAPDADVATPFVQKVLTDFKALKDSGASPADVRDRMGDYLFELQGVKAASGGEATVAPGDLYYFKKSLTTEEISSLGTVKDLNDVIIASSPLSPNAYKKPYVFLGTSEQRQQAFANAARIGGDGENSYPTLAAAWKAGHDVAFNSDLTVRVNDASKLWSRVDDPIYNSNRFLNTRTGAFTEDTVLTAADTVMPGASLEVTPTAVKIPVKDGATRIIKMTETVPEGADTEYFTARHAWASKLTDDQLPNTIDVTDFSLMDRLRNVQNEETLQGITITSGKDNVLGTADHLSIPDTIKAAKLSEAQRLFSEAHEEGKFLDTRAVAYQLNVDAPWLENAVGTRFRENLAGQSTSGKATVDMKEGLSLPLDSYTRRENLIAEFARPQQFRELDTLKPTQSWQERRNIIQASVNNSGGQFVTGDLAWSYRVQQAMRANKNAAAAVLGEGAQHLPDLAQDGAKLANSLGSGATPLGSSNADYGDTLRLAMQESGKQTHLMVQRATSDAMDTIGPAAMKLKGNRVAAAEVGIVTNILRGTDEKYIWGEGNQLILRELKGLTGEDLNDAVQAMISDGRKPTIELQNQDAADFFRVHTDMNADRVQKRAVLMNAKGMTSNYDPEVVYAPPIDTTYFQHFAFVRPIQGKAFGTSEVSMVFGRNAAELQKRISTIDRQNFDVVTKKGTEDWFKAKDAYDFDKTINEPRINSELRRSGVLSNVYPEVRAETVAEDYIRWHQNQVGRLVRDAVETNYAQQFAELRAMGQDYTEIATSKFSGTTKRTSTEIVNPFDDYIKTALDVSKRSEYTFLHQINEFVDSLGVRAYQAYSSAFGDAEKGLIPWEDVNSIAKKHGITGLYDNQQQYFTANVPRDRNAIKETITKANAILANSLLRLDFFNSVMNTVSTPMMMGTELASIRTAAKNNPEVLGKLMDALTIAVPSNVGPTKGIRIPSMTKLVAQATQNFFGDTGKTLLARYKANGDVLDETLSNVHNLIDSLGMRADYKAFSDGTQKALDIGAKISLNTQAEQFTRFISADVMRQLTEDSVQAGTLTLKEQNAFISVFTNRVQGNYVTSQRPIVFQGVLGSAISLFQTYSFNVLQQLLRHTANQDKRAVATMFGMQAGLFGLNGTPFFEAVNTHIIGNSAINQGHYDAYSIAPALVGKPLGDWLMYGTASAMPFIMDGKQPALYSRGDINPRHITILPVSPLDIPAIDAGIKVVGNIINMGSKIAGGAAVVPSLLQGLEHNGISRPLAGFAQVLQGQSTTSKGSLISASSDFDLVANASRLLGSRPMDEAVALNNLYRMQAYQAADHDRMEQLGERVKTYLGRNQPPPESELQQFQSDYARAGGRIENYQAAMQRWMKQANTSTVNTMKARMNTSYGQRLSEIMGGNPLPDWSQVPVTAPEPGVEEQQ